MTNVLTSAKKFGVAVLGTFAQLLATGTLPDEYKSWGVVVIALATALGVYGAKNAEPDEL